jgi:hypothetical protein
MNVTVFKVTLCSFIMQVLMISTRGASRWAAKALLTSPSTRRGMGYVIRPVIATPFSVRFKSTAPDDTRVMASSTIDAVNGVNIEDMDDDDVLDSVLDDVLGEAVEEEEYAVSSNVSVRDSPPYGGDNLK